MHNTGLRNTPYALAGGLPGYQALGQAGAWAIREQLGLDVDYWTFGLGLPYRFCSGLRRTTTAQQRLHKVGGALARGPIHALGTLGATVTEESGYDYACPIVGH